VGKNFRLAASAALVFLAVAARLAYAWRLGVAPQAELVVAGAACAWVVGAVASRLGGAWAAAAASFLWAILPAAVVANTFFPRETYAALAGAASLYYFLEPRAAEKRKPFPQVAAGLLAGVAAAFSTPYLALAAFYLLWSITRAFGEDGVGARAFLWLGGLGALVAVAVGLEYLRAGEPFAHLRDVLAAAPAAYPETKLLIKRLGADAAAMLFWDALGFGFVGVAGLAAAAYYLGARNRAAHTLAAFLVLALAAYNFAPTSLGRYAPMALEPTRWLAAAVAATALAGAAAAELLSGEAGALRRWAGALGGAAVLATLFVNGNKPFAPAGLVVLWVAVAATLGLAGAARRAGEGAGRRAARLAGAGAILIIALPAIILYL
jgi:hypothetical protein